MRLDDFDYDLPVELIAQTPSPRRDHSRLMHYPRTDGEPEHYRFDAITGLLKTGDLLVVNTTRVRPARLHVRKPTGGLVELLLLEPAAEPNHWEAWLKCTRKPEVGTTLRLPDGQGIQIVAREGKRWRIRFEGDPDVAMQRHGSMPLPPYIKRDPAVDELKAADAERYQTVYSDQIGAVAAPTAGLHFTEELLAEIESRGIQRAAVTLHVGAGTFAPVTAEEISEHRMHSEWFEIPDATAKAIAATRARGGRVIAVGTTVTRTLEYVAGQHGQVVAASGDCDLFITPGFEFKVIDGLLTNLHLPQSTLLMLVAAFVGMERMRNAYAEAVSMRYRFFSYGDAMLLL